MFPPFLPLSVARLSPTPFRGCLSALAKEQALICSPDEYVPDVAFPGREGRERVRVLRRLGQSTRDCALRYVPP